MNGLLPGDGLYLSPAIMPEQEDEMIKIELTNEEANALATLLDIAVKAGGIRSAGAALVILQRLEEAAKAAEAEKTDGN